MAISRTRSHEVATVDINDDGGVTITVAEEHEDGSYWLRASVGLTLDEAEDFARDIRDAIIEAAEDAAEETNE